MNTVLASAIVVICCAALVASDDNNPFNLPHIGLVFQKVCQAAGQDDQAVVDKFYACYDRATVSIAHKIFDIVIY